MTHFLNPIVNTMYICTETGARSFFRYRCHLDTLTGKNGREKVVVSLLTTMWDTPVHKALKLAKHYQNNFTCEEDPLHHEWNMEELVQWLSVYNTECPEATICCIYPEQPCVMSSIVS